MPKALQHDLPYSSGHTRIVSAKRARKLRKRGVPLMAMHPTRTVSTDRCYEYLGFLTYTNQLEPTTPDTRARYAWFERNADVEERKRRRARQCYGTHLLALQGKTGRKAWLHMRLNQQREAHAYFNLLNAAMQQLETATGVALDALCGVAPRPSGMTDAELRTYAQQGYTLRVGRVTNKMSPPLMAFVPAYVSVEIPLPSGLMAIEWRSATACEVCGSYPCMCATWENTP